MNILKKKLKRYRWESKNARILGICHLCKNKFNHRFGCDAFPEGIPDEILMGENDHKEPLKGQKNNIVFEPKEK